MEVMGFLSPRDVSQAEPESILRTSRCLPKKALTRASSTAIDLACLFRAAGLWSGNGGWSFAE